jgi:hypothetical protein
LSWIAYSLEALLAALLLCAWFQVLFLLLVGQRQLRAELAGVLVLLVVHRCLED